MTILPGLRTSEEWNQDYGYDILDPDGWDRKNFQYSFYEEKISEVEFLERVLFSTIGNVEKRTWRLK